LGPVEQRGESVGFAASPVCFNHQLFPVKKIKDPSTRKRMDLFNPSSTARVEASTGAGTVASFTRSGETTEMANR